MSEAVRFERYTPELAAVPLADGFFDGWPNQPDAATHRRILSDSYLAYVAVADGRIIGFLNVISDGVLTAYIPLLEVVAPYRGRGIGSRLVSLALAALDDFYMVDLLCDPAVQDFYAKAGLSRAAGMCRRNYARQGGRVD